MVKSQYAVVPRRSIRYSPDRVTEHVCARSSLSHTSFPSRSCTMPSSSRDADQIEYQNDQRLDELTSKIRTLRGVRSNYILTTPYSVSKL